MRYLLILILFAGAATAMAQDKQKLTVEDIFGTEGHKAKFLGKSVKNLQWIENGKAFTYLEKNEEGKQNDIYRYDIKSGKRKLLIEGSTLIYENEPINFSRHKWSANEQYLLLTGKQKKIWRHSRQARFYIFNKKNDKITALAGNNPDVQNAKISPDGSRVGYLLENNLYVADIETGESRALTNDGSETILNGVFDWVYEEEFGSADAWRWSPDGKKIAFWQLDQSPIKPFNYLLDQRPLYNEVKTVRYPKVGTKNSLVKIGVVDVQTGQIVWMNLGDEEDIYIPRIEWTNDAGTLAIQRLNRRQNKMQLLFADVATGNTRLILTLQSDAWVEVGDDLKFLKKSERFIWTSEKNGYRHIYLFNLNGKQLKQLTSGDWEVSAIADVDEGNGWVYFYGKKDSPVETHLYRVKLDGGEVEKISGKPGFHRVRFAPAHQHYIDYFSDIRTPTQVILCKANGKRIRFVEENKIEALNKYELSEPEFLTFTTDDGIELNAYMIKPPDFDPGKKYPVLVYGYGGPGSQVVTNSWKNNRGLWHQMMCQKGYIIFVMDNRGTGGRGAAFKHLAYGDLSKWAVQDHIEGAKFLATLPFVDSKRIGFWGWSGGGYLSCNLIMRGADYFKTAVAVAPVTDFRLYDTIWTERYMGLLPENEAGYDSASVLNYAHLLKGDLLLIHGSGDDNVHLQNTMQLVDELIKEGKQFDLMIYPNRAHSISGGNTQTHLFKKISEYFLENL